MSGKILEMKISFEHGRVRVWNTVANYRKLDIMPVPVATRCNLSSQFIIDLGKKGMASQTWAEGYWTRAMRHRHNAPHLKPGSQLWIVGIVLFGESDIE